MTTPPYERDDSEIAYEQVADHLAALISAGVLPPGSMLANERSLAAEYGVAVGTARKAAQLLEQRGLIKVRRSKGKFVLPDVETRLAALEAEDSGSTTDEA